MLQKIFTVACALVLFGAMAVPSAFGMDDMLNFKTNAPLELPGRVIPAGKYQIMNATPTQDMPVVEVLNSKGKFFGFYHVEDVRGSSANPVKVKKEKNSVDRLSEFFSPDSGTGYRFEYPHQKPLA